MTRWQMWKELRAAMKDPARAGDVAAYKGALSGARARPAVEEQLDAVRDTYPVTDLDALVKLDDGTFGREFARFMEANGLNVIAPSDEVPTEVLRSAAFTVRYAAVHDMIHVLTGFDASWPGEVGVWAFVGGQNYSFGFRVAAVVALLFTPFRSPLRLRSAWRNFRAGWAMGRRARTLVAQQLETRFEHGLEDVRAELRVVGAGDGYVPRALQPAAATSQ
ncbi:MAG: hypothetical protein K0V04_12265 [Deltaproteobacteria bacterium]|nr:hypothetical protein [Deltaproteobacteria bacterium]